MMSLLFFPKTSILFQAAPPIPYFIGVTSPTPTPSSISPDQKFFNPEAVDLPLPFVANETLFKRLDASDMHFSALTLEVPAWHLEEQNKTLREETEPSESGSGKQKNFK